jgi:tripeptide aminopeptidase
MVEELKKHPEVISIAEEAINRIGVKIIDKPIRGGTDGAQLSFRGLPTPNIFNGGINFHSKKEFIPVYSMEKAVQVILKILEISVQRSLN